MEIQVSAQPLLKAYQDIKLGPVNVDAKCEISYYFILECSNLKLKAKAT